MSRIATKKDRIITILQTVATQDANTKKWMLPPEFCALLDNSKERTLNGKKSSCICGKTSNVLLFWPLENDGEDKIVKGMCWSGKIKDTNYDNLYLTSQWGAMPDGTGTSQKFCALIEEYEKTSKRHILKKDDKQLLTTPESQNTSSILNSQFPRSRNLIVFGAPGTGKSHYLDGERVKKKKDVIEDSDSEESYFARCERVTFYPTYSYAQFVGSYKPVMKEVDKDGIELGPAKNDEHTRKAIAYEFVPGPFLRILKDAWRNQDKNYLLIIEEINRANAAAVFGDVFQLLDRNNDNGESVYSISPSREMIEYLRRKSSDGRDGVANDVALKLRIPSNLYIWATMNSADQGVFPLDTAFKRRWDFKYRSLDDNTSNDGVMVEVGDYICKWGALRKAINEVLKRSRVSEDKMLSSSFVCPDIISVGRVKEVISAERFEMKVLMYLWEDAARMCRQNVFSDDVKVLSDLIKAWNGARFDDVEEPDPEGKKPKRGVLRAGLNLGDTKFDFFEKEKPAEDKGQEEDAEPQPPPQEKPAEAHAEAPAAQAPAAEAHAAEGNAGEEEKEAHPAEETDKGQKKGEEPQVKD